MKRHLSILLFAAFAVQAASSYAWASAPPSATDNPRQLVENIHAEIQTVFKENASKPAPVVQKKITPILESFIDFEKFARRSFKKYFDDSKVLSKKKRREFVQTFKDLIRSTYLRRIDPKSKFTMVLDGPTKYARQNTMAQVRTITTTTKGELDIDFLLQRSSDGSWKTYDIVIDDVSMARNYRSEFYRIMRKHKTDGVRHLLKTIRDRIKEQQN
tara:strand:- start:2011 stop:2655 length:645 start_codon:yes stop_codon:yes gene_type:complete